MKLARASYDWTIKHLVRDHDTDLFPLPIEIDAIKAEWTTLVMEFQKIEVSSYAWRGGLLGRRADLLVRHSEPLREAVKCTRADRPFHIDAWSCFPITCIA